MWAHRFPGHIRFDPDSGVLTFLAPVSYKGEQQLDDDETGPIPKAWLLNEETTTPAWDKLLLLETDDKHGNKIPVTETRTRLSNWMFEVVAIHELSRHTFGFAVNYMDRYLLAPDTMGALQFVGAVCLFIASKFEDRTPVSVRNLVKNSGNMFPLEDIVLSKLNWNLVHTPCSMFLDALLRELPYLTAEDARFVHLCNFLCDAAMTSWHVLKHMSNASRLAAAILVYTATVLKLDEQPITQLLTQPPLSIDTKKEMWSKQLKSLKQFHITIFKDEENLWGKIKRVYAKTDRHRVSKIDP